MDHAVAGAGWYAVVCPQQRDTFQQRLETVDLAMTIHRAWRGFMLRAELEHATQRPPQSTAVMEGALQQAIAQWRAARALADEGDWPAALDHYARALTLCLGAMVEDKNTGAYVDATSSQAWHALTQALPDMAAQIQLQFPGVPAFMKEPQRPVWAGRTAPAVSALALDAPCSMLVDRLEMLLPGRLYRARAGRFLGLLGMVVLVGFYALAWVVAPPNLARGAQVTTSSLRPGSPRAGGITNGVMEASYGLHTAVEERPWVELDLGAPQLVRRVVVFPRGDGWWSECLPLVLDVIAQDGKVVHSATRTNAFTPGTPWEVEIPSPSNARKVRFHVPKHSYIALTEVQVFAR
jgi:hypothetical protein